MYRIAVGEISHETNTFCPPTTLEMFKGRIWCSGEELLAKFGGTRASLGGMIETASRLGVTLIPTFAASTEPWGTITREAYDAMLGELADGIRAAMPVDAVCLALHGAGVAEPADDLEGAVLAAVRGVVGPDAPIAVTLDLHGNVTPEMASLATGLFTVHEYPHTDSYERGCEAMGFLVGVLDGRIRPSMALEVLPLLITPAPSGLEPVRAINEICHRFEQEPGVLDCALMHGFPYSNIPEAASSVIVITDGDPTLARRVAREVAGEVWARREGFRRIYPMPAEAVAEALRAAGDGGPIVINETSDNPGGGAPGDGTHLLRAMLEAGLTDSAFGTVYDPEIAEAAHRAGAGARISVALGGRHDRMHGDPLEIEVYVKSLADGQFRLSGPMGRGWPVDLGRSARLTAGGVEIVVVSRRSQVLDVEPFLLHGIDVHRCRIVGLKSSAHFRAAYEPLAARIVTTDPPGLCSSNLAHFTLGRVRRPIWPLDPETAYVPGASS